MTVLATARPVPRSVARPQASAVTARRPPRLLLPPRADPEPRASVTAEPALPQPRSVLSPLTESAWPVPARRIPAGHEPELADPTRLCGAVVLAAVEALRSTRPLTQLARWVSPEVYEALARAAQPSTAGPAPRGAVVRSLRVCRINRVVAEGTAVVHDGTRVRAAAVRFEVHRGSWRATVLQIG